MAEEQSDEVIRSYEGSRVCTLIHSVKGNNKAKKKEKKRAAVNILPSLGNGKEVELQKILAFCLSL